MFKFPATLDTIDEVPDLYKPLYNKTDDERFALCDDLKDVISQGGQLSETVDKERKRANNLERELKGWKKLGETPDDVQAKLDEGGAELQKKVEELQALVDEKGDVSKQIDKMRSDMEKAHNKVLGEKDQKITDLEGSLRKHLIESAAVAAISEAKGRVKPLLPTVLGKLSMVAENGDYVVRVVDADGDARSDGKGGFMDIAGLVTELKDDPDYAPLFEASGTTGAGSGKTRAPAASGGGAPGLKNPWNPATKNLTEQMRIVKENPQLAARLQAQAGVA